MAERGNDAVTGYPLETKKRLGAKPNTPDPATPRSWWQWLLVYPSLLLAIAGSIPTAFEIARVVSTGAAFGQSKDALQQDDLWNRNMTCMQAPFEGFKNQYNINTDATICKSGDVLVRFMGPKDERAYRWVPVERFEEKKKVGFSFINSAVASEVNLAQFDQVVCQWSPQSGFVVRRTRNPQNNQCFNETVRTYTGEVISRIPVSCNTPCGS